MTDADGEAVGDAAARRFGRRAVLAFAAVLIAAVPFCLLLVLVASSWSPLHRLDVALSDNLHAYAIHHPAFTRLMRIVTNTGSSLAWIVVLLPVVGWLLWRRLPRLAVFVAVTAVGSSALNNLIKMAVRRARPHFDDPVATAIGASFPSGHTQATIVGWGILLLVFLPVIPTRWRPPAMLFGCLMVALVGFSRIALGVHYLSDVVGALLIGSAWLLAMTAAFSAWRRDLGRPDVEISRGLEPESRGRMR